jgi:hypothetical protein
MTSCLHIGITLHLVTLGERRVKEGELSLRALSRKAGAGGRFWRAGSGGQILEGRF